MVSLFRWLFSGSLSPLGEPWEEADGTYRYQFSNEIENLAVRHGFCAYIDPAETHIGIMTADGGEAARIYFVGNSDVTMRTFVFIVSPLPNALCGELLVSGLPEISFAGPGVSPWQFQW